MTAKVNYKKFLTSSPVQKTGGVRVDYTKFLPSKQIIAPQIEPAAQVAASQSPTQIDLSKVKQGVGANLPSAIGETVSGFIKGLVSPFAKVGVGLYNVAAQVAQPRTDQMISRDIPLLGKTEPFLTGDEKLREFAKKVVGSGLELAPYFVALPETKGILKILDTVGNKSLKDISAKEARQFIKAYAQKVAKSSATIGPTFGLGQSLQEDANLPETAKNILGATVTVATLETFLSPIMRQMFKSGGTKTVNESLKEFVESKEPPALPALTAGEQPKLLGTPTVKATGEGFVMTEKTNKSKVAEMKVRNTLSEAVKKYNKNPTETNLKNIQKLRAKFSKVLPGVPPETPVVSKDFGSLSQEARKYKSAEEFVKAQELLYHGTSKESAAAIRKADGFTPETAKSGIDLFGGKVSDSPVAMTLDEATGKLYAGPRPEGGTGELLTFSGKGLKIADERVANSFRYKNGQPVPQAEYIEKLRKSGYDGYHTSSPHDEAVETVVFNKEKLKLTSQSKSQLTDIWNKANQVTKQPETVEPSVKTIEVPKEQLPVGTGKEKVSRLEARMKDMLGKLTEEERADLTLYRGVVKETQFAEGAAYVDKVGEDAALAVLEGKGVPPEGLLYSTIDIALRAKATDNAELALKLGTSRATRFGQEISMYRGQDTYHPVVAIEDIQLVRQKNLETRTRKSYDKLVEEEKGNITREINKSTKISPAKVTRENVMEFIDSIVC